MMLIVKETHVAKLHSCVSGLNIKITVYMYTYMYEELFMILTNSPTRKLKNELDFYVSSSNIHQTNH